MKVKLFVGPALNSNSGAYRLAVLAKALDAAGSGYVPAPALRAYVMGLGVPALRYSRWLEAALILGLFVASKDRLARAGEAKVIERTQGESDIVVTFKTGPAVFIGDRALVSKGWRAAIWKEYYATTKGKPISRAIMQDITGVSPTAQLALEKQAGIAEPKKGEGKPDYKKRNYAIIQLSAKKFLPLFQQAGGRKYFAFTVRGMRYAQIAYRLPNSYHVETELPKKGRSRKINSELKQLRVVTSPAAKGRVSGRIYCDSTKQAATSKREICYTMRAKASFRSNFWTEHRHIDFGD